MADHLQVNTAEFAQCYASWTADELVIGNAYIERQWRIKNGLLFATSLRDHVAGYEWLAKPSETAAPMPPFTVPDEPRRVRVTATPGAQTPVGEASLLVEVVAEGDALTLTYRFVVYPDAAAETMQLLTSTMDDAAAIAMDTVDEAIPTGIETERREANAPDNIDAIEYFALGSQHARLRQVSLADQTDAHNELVQEREWLLHPSERSLQLQGNLFVLEDALTGAGLVFLKEAPLPHARPITSPWDLSVTRARQLAVNGHGIGQGVGEGYPMTVLTFQDGRVGCTQALHRYQRQVRRFDPERDGLFLSNTWGDRSQDSRVNEPFMLREVEAGSRLGVEVIQIDDGWQMGCTVNSAQSGGVWEGYWQLNGEFWSPHPDRFPDGLQPVIDQARASGMQFGLWFSPDSSDDFANWERDAGVILDLHRTYGVNYFKIDGVKARTRLGETRLHRFFEHVLRESGGAVVFDLDITAEIRPGYFGLMYAGPLFVENRYTDWHNYWPHQTLRNLWTLSHYIDPVRLRMELLNNIRNTEAYAGDPLAPACCSAGYLFAITMLSSPLGWFEVSNLPEEYFIQIAPLAEVWKAHRARLFSGCIVPIGAQPDGVSWTGFLSRQEDGSAYALVFRELNDRPEWSVELSQLDGREYRCDVLAGTGSATCMEGRCTINLPAPFSYQFLRLTEITG